jgi:DNA-binding transcriptional ArsR family regulator
MNNPNISIPAALIGEPTRAAILMALMDGRAHAAGALSTALNISPQSASNHLSLLVEGGLLSAMQQGRHRYYRLSSIGVADALESLALIAAPLRVQSLNKSIAAKPLHNARCCYSHLAGALGVHLLEALQKKEYLTEDGLTNTGRTNYRLSASGQSWTASLGFPTRNENALNGQRYAISCLDWTERRSHLAGLLGKQFLSHFLEHEILLRGSAARSLVLSRRGIDFFQTELDTNAFGTFLRQA